MAGLARENNQPATLVLVCPGFVIEITPAQVHMHLHDDVSAGKLLTVTVGEPGAHGAGMTGTQAWGAPRAAMTSGLVGAVHIPNGGMLAMGAKSIIVAAGVGAVTVGADVALNVEGAAPKLHCIIAPLTTSCPIQTHY